MQSVAKDNSPRPGNGSSSLEQKLRQALVSARKQSLASRQADQNGGPLVPNVTTPDNFPQETSNKWQGSSLHKGPSSKQQGMGPLGLYSEASILDPVATQQQGLLPAQQDPWGDTSDWKSSLQHLWNSTVEIPRVRSVRLSDVGPSSIGDDVCAGMLLRQRQLQAEQPGDLTLSLPTGRPAASQGISASGASDLSFHDAEALLLEGESEGVRDGRGGGSSGDVFGAHQGGSMGGLLADRIASVVGSSEAGGLTGELWQQQQQQQQQQPESKDAELPVRSHQDHLHQQLLLLQQQEMLLLQQQEQEGQLPGQAGSYAEQQRLSMLQHRLSLLGDVMTGEGGPKAVEPSVLEGVVTPGGTLGAPGASPLPPWELGRSYYQQVFSAVYDPGLDKEMEEPPAMFSPLDFAVGLDRLDAAFEELGEVLGEPAEAFIEQQEQDQLSLFQRDGRGSEMLLVEGDLSESPGVGDEGVQGVSGNAQGLDSTSASHHFALSPGQSSSSEGNSHQSLADKLPLSTLQGMSPAAVQELLSSLGIQAKVDGVAGQGSGDPNGSPGSSLGSHRLNGGGLVGTGVPVPGVSGELGAAGMAWPTQEYGAGQLSEALNGVSLSKGKRKQASGEGGSGSAGGSGISAGGDSADSQSRTVARTGSGQAGGERTELEGSFSAARALETADVGPVHLLTQLAEATARGDDAKAAALIAQLNEVASQFGNASQRVSAYFLEGFLKALPLQESEAEREALARLKAEPPPLPFRSKADPSWYAHECELHVVKAFQMLMAATPYVSFGQVTGNCVILEACAGAPAVHIVDIGTGHGLHLLPLVRALAGRPGCAPRVRITTVEMMTTATHRSYCALTTAERLEAEATKWGLTHLEMGIVPTSPLLDFSPDQLDLRPEETVVVNCSPRLGQLLGDIDGRKQGQESRSPYDLLIDTIRRIRPKVCTVVEHHLNRGASPFFLSRFYETIHYYLGLFESLDASVTHQHSQEKRVLEREVLGRAIVNSIASEGHWVRERGPSVGGFASEAQMLLRERMKLAGFKPRPVSENQTNVAKQLLLTYKEGFGLEMVDTNSLLLKWKDQGLVATSAWEFD